jgi:hypothetical protein
LWKSYFILKILEATREGDIIVYADAGCTITGSPQGWIDLARNYGAIFFRLTHKMKTWTKGDVFAALDMPMDV